MSVARRKGNPGRADFLFSRLIRSHGYCQYPDCASPGPFDTAHIIGRRYSATRCQEDNAWCLCRSHHQKVDGWADEKIALVEATIGLDRYWQLRTLAEGGIPSASRFWADEVARLEDRCREQGIDMRRSA